MSNWTESKVLITGGTRGIGFAVAAGLVALGGQVVVVGTDHTRATLAVERLNATGIRAQALIHTLDGTPQSGQIVVSSAVTLMGGLTAVVNAAGGAQVGHALDVSWDTWRDSWNVKFWGYFSVARAAVPYLTGSAGVIVNVLGVTGKDPNSRLAVPSTINGALRGLTKVLADDLAPQGIRVIAVNPGATETDLLQEMAHGYAELDQVGVEESLHRLRASGPLGGLPQARDVAAAVLFLLSPEARFITGTSIDIDGGTHRGPA